MRPPGPPVFYFSLRSPYSWLAYEDLHHRYPDIVPLLEWRPFWEPDARSAEMLAAAGGRFVYTPMSREKHLYILTDVRRLATQRGLAVTWPIDRDPHWEVPHLAYLVAREAGVGGDFIGLTCQARWQQGRDICDPAVLADLASKLGLDEARLAGAHEDERLRQQGVQALLDLHRDDVFGVPLFKHRREKFWGLDRLPAFVAAVRGAAPVPVGAEPPEPPEPVADDRATDFGPAGGCG